MYIPNQAYLTHMQSIKTVHITHFKGIAFHYANKANAQFACHPWHALIKADGVFRANRLSEAHIQIPTQINMAYEVLMN